MRTLIILITVVLVVGCGKTDIERLEEENRRLKAQLENDKLKADLEPKPNPVVPKPTPVVPKFLSDKDIVGTYEHKIIDPTTGLPIDDTRLVFLDNSVVEFSVRGLNISNYKWKIVGINTIDAPRYEQVWLTLNSVDYEVYRINQDNSITHIADRQDGKETERPKRWQLTYKKIK